MAESFRGIAVYPRPNEDPDRFIKRFLKKVRNEGVLQEVFLRRSFEKPSVKRRRKRARARFLRQLESKG